MWSLVTPLIVSVVVPIYNGADTVVQALESVFAQTFGEYEIVVVNDGCTDETCEVLAKIAEPRIRVINQHNAGPAHARATGLVACRGEFVAFLDHDDIWVKNKLQLQVDALRRHPEAGAAYCWTDSFESDPDIRKALCRDVYSGNVYPQLLMGNFTCSGSNLMFRKDLLSRVPNLRAMLCPAEDWMLALEVARYHDFVCVPEALVYYRQGQSSASTSTLKMEASLIKIIEQGFRHVPELQHRKALSISNAYCYLIDKSLAQGPAGLEKEVLAAKLFCGWLRRVPPWRLPKKVFLRILSSLLFGRINPNLRRFPHAEAKVPDESRARRVLEAVGSANVRSGDD